MNPPISIVPCQGEERMLSSDPQPQVYVPPWHFLNLRPLPQGQGELRPIFPASRTLALVDDSFWQEAHVQAAG